MTVRRVYNQAEFDRAVADKVDEIEVCDSATVTAYGSATVRAYDSATVTAYGSATVTACGSATVRAYDSATVRASKCVAVTDHGPATTVVGGVLISIRRASNGTEWCDFYGVGVIDGVAVLFKAVGDDWKGDHKTTVTYQPGQIPTAPDWKPHGDCGNGLHFSPRPWMAEQHLTGNPAHYVGCPVKVDTLVLIDDKVKAPGCCGPVFEVDVDGNRIEPEQTAKKRAKKAQP